MPSCSIWYLAQGKSCRAPLRHSTLLPAWLSLQRSCAVDPSATSWAFSSWTNLTGTAMQKGEGNMSTQEWTRGISEAGVGLGGKNHGEGEAPSCGLGGARYRKVHESSPV